MKLNLFYLAIVSQILVIAFLFVQISNKMRSTLGASVSIVNPKTITKTLSDEFTYFYEPRENLTIETHEDWLPYVSTYTINSDSLNERFEYEEQKKEGVFRIITLGDSFTYGSYVNTKDNWTEVLEDSLNSKKKCPQIRKFEVINLGVGGYDAAYEVERYKLRGTKYQPDLIIMLIVDFMRITEYRMEHTKTYSPTQIAEFQKKGAFHPGQEEDQRLSDEVRIKYQYPQYGKLFSLYSGKVLIVDHEKNNKGKDFFEKLRKKYPRLVYIKTTLPFIEKSTSLPDGHPNKDGHKAIADNIFQYITNSTLIPCSP